MNKSNKKQYVWSIILILCALIWGSIHPVTKHLMEGGISPVLMSFLRFFLAAVFMVPLYRRESKKNEKPSLKQTAMLCFLGFFGVAGFSLLIFYGIDLSNATSSAILINSQPVFAAVFGALILKEKFGGRHIIGVFLGVLGMAIVVTRGDLGALSLRSDYVAGNLLCISGALLISLYYIGLKKYVERFGSTIPTFISTAAGAVVIFIVAMVEKEDFRVLLEVRAVDWLWIMHIAVITTAVTNLLFNRALHAIGVIKATGYKFLVPVFGVFLSFIFLGERMNAAVYIGIGVVLAAILFIQGGVLLQRMSNRA